MPSLIRIAFGLAGLAVPGAVLAAASCLVSATPLNLGNYDHLYIFGTSSQSTVTVSCQENAFIGLGDTVNYSISFDAGGSGDINDRSMTQGTDDLHYNLYTNFVHTTVLGDGISGQTLEGTLIVPLCVLGLGCATVSAVRNVFGYIPPSQIVSAGSYSDTIIVTVTY